MLSDHESDWMVPERYDDLSELDKGTYGDICTATDTTNSNTVVIKRVSKVFESQNKAKCILREIRLLKHVKHHNLIRLLDVFCEPDDADTISDVYMVTVFMENTLHKRLHYDQTELTDDYKILYMYQILNGIRYLHSCNIVHRDLKPHNITITDRELKIIDFGLGREEAPNMTDYIMTRNYRAPEVIVELQPFTRALDMWSIGCIFCEILTRRILFRPNSMAQHLLMIVSMLGTPPEDFMMKINPNVRGFLVSRNDSTDTKNFASYFPEIDPTSELGNWALDLLQKLLTINPIDRIDCNKAMQHPYLSKYYSEEDEVDGPLFENANENYDLEIDKFKNHIYKEIMNFNPDSLNINDI